MPESYTIVRVSPAVRDVPLDHGDFKAYRFYCEGKGETVFSLLQKPETAPPAAGDTFEATVKSTFDDGTVNLKKVQQQRANGGGGKGPRTEGEEKWITARFAVEEANKLLVADVIQRTDQADELARRMFALVVELAP